jgi:hypothetical protein
VFKYTLQAIIMPVFFSSEEHETTESSLYINWQYHICVSLFNLIDVAAIWFVLADPLAEHENDSSHH